ncbi:MAG TPA: sulfite oxidase, partial [Gemmataceae bacterium]|nr:sulfite oxidase [Gemmataceae bacterium]
AGRAMAAQTPAGQAYPGLIIRVREPQNLEFPFPTLDRFLIPTERFYVRNHFATPYLNVEPGRPIPIWRLRVEGAVERPLSLTYEEIRKLPSRTGAALLECAGNSRVFLVPRAHGLLWELGAVGTAEWTGVPLAAILDRAGVRKEAVEVILEGADSGEIRDPPSTPGVIHFARSLPLARARRPEVLLAYRMNGANLTPAHGFPLRAVVPGWYAMASIKWLTRIIVSERPFQGYFQTLDYSYFERVHGTPTLTPITELQVKALIARPTLNEVITANQMYRVHGAAWTGDSEVARVEVSTDGGQKWEAARLLDKPVAHAWRLWEYNWRTPAGGRRTLMARATDKRGRTQPLKRDPDRRNYMISHVLPIDVEVR